MDKLSDEVLAFGVVPSGLAWLTPASLVLMNLDFLGATGTSRLEALRQDGRTAPR